MGNVRCGLEKLFSSKSDDEILNSMEEELSIDS